MNHFDDSSYYNEERIKELYEDCLCSAHHKITFFLPHGMVLKEIIIQNFLNAYREEEESAKRFIDYFKLTEYECVSLWEDLDHFRKFYYHEVSYASI